MKGGSAIKKTLTTLLAVIMVFYSVNLQGIQTAKAERIATSDGFVLGESTGTIEEYTGNESIIMILNRINGITVEKINSGAYMNSSHWSASI